MIFTLSFGATEEVFIRKDLFKPDVIQNEHEKWRNPYTGFFQNSDPYKYTHSWIFRFQGRYQGSAAECTATMVKLEQDKCFLLTSAHCVENYSEVNNFLVIAFAPKNYLGQPLERQGHLGSAYSYSVDPVFSGTHNFSQSSTSVKKYSEIIDVAELEIPSSLSPFCKKLRSTPVLLPDESNMVAALIGNVQSSPEEHYMNGKKPAGSALFKYERYFYGKESSNDYFYKISTLLMSPGQSGGSAYDMRGKWIGLASRFPRYEQETLLTPAHIISHFLMSPSPKMNSSLTPVANKQIPGGGNSHLGGGGNSHLGGGILLSDIVDNRIENKNPLLPFMEADEGIPDPKDSSKIILAINGEQVDGLDDYQMINAQNKIKSVWSRPRNGLPSIEIRKSIFDRLRGEYSGLLNSHNNSDLHTIWTKNLQKVEMWEPQFQGQTSNEIKIWRERDGHYHLSIRRINDILFHYPDRQLKNALYTPGEDWHFLVQFNEDASVVTLTPDHETQQRGHRAMRCLNRHAFKLICQNELAFLSLSKYPQHRGNILKFSWGRLSDPAGSGTFNSLEQIHTESVPLEDK